MRALIYMAKTPGRVVPAQELTDKLGMPRAFSRRILQVLSREGILESVKGKGGGFILRKPTKEVHVLDLMQAFQGNVKLLSCVLQKDVCPNIRTCPLRSRMRNLEKHVLSEFRSMTIASLLKG